MQTILPVTRILVLLTVLLAAGGCGLKGDLYLPETPPEPERPPAAQQDSEDEDEGPSSAS